MEWQWNEVRNETKKISEICTLLLRNRNFSWEKLEQLQDCIGKATHAPYLPDACLLLPKKWSHRAQQRHLTLSKQPKAPCQSSERKNVRRRLYLQLRTYLPRWVCSEKVRVWISYWFAACLVPCLGTTPIRYLDESSHTTRFLYEHCSTQHGWWTGKQW